MGDLSSSARQQIEQAVAGTVHVASEAAATVDAVVAVLDAQQLQDGDGQPPQHDGHDWSRCLDAAPTPDAPRSPDGYTCQGECRDRAPGAVAAAPTARAVPPVPSAGEDEAAVERAALTFNAWATGYPADKAEMVWSHTAEHLREDLRTAARAALAAARGPRTQEANRG